MADELPDVWVVVNREEPAIVEAHITQERATESASVWSDPAHWSYSYGSITVHPYVPASRLTAAQEQVERLRGLCRVALEAWEGTGPPIMLDDLRDAVAGRPLGEHIPRLAAKESKG